MHNFNITIINSHLGTTTKKVTQELSPFVLSMVELMKENKLRSLSYEFKDEAYGVPTVVVISDPEKRPIIRLKETLINFYREFWNDYLTVDKFANDYDLTKYEAERLIHIGRKYHNINADKLKKEKPYAITIN